jgi:hypothetical protein
MLIVSLIVSGLMLLAANWIVFRARKPVGKLVTLILGLALAPIFVLFVSPPVMLQGLLFALVVIVWRASKCGPSLFGSLSCAATLVAYGVAGRIAWQSQTEYARLRAIYPYESMETRLPAPKPASGDLPLTAPASQRLDRLEARLDEDRYSFRNSQLESLHEHAVALFINSPGFGVTRMITPAEWSLAFSTRREPVPSQPRPCVPSRWSPGDFERPPASDEEFLAWMFEDGVQDFVFSRGWGYVKDRRHVAGFLSHRFSEAPAPTSRSRWKMQNHKLQLTEVPVPEPTTRWKVRTLELLGLLLEDEPVVYMSDHLPAMDELRGAPTRPLDKFETIGLTEVQRGEDLFISRDGAGLRMLGAIRSVKQCVACHGGKRGDLLGAFSYALQRQSD